ncbi:M23 family metallopeptidase [Luteimonas sp. S4-F44]|uniref:M23 family metallopeptidase n=1 Tax=Luteimonas sp. S4-F44 TaxID=2925842 RepID=UPI001F532254|nr:M23 family metallopeptidase [Luteimonas sp. S4-F44]UNK42077.1 M23 family metallopeptidase [Luteimonas sp. S4-F44]
MTRAGLWIALAAVLALANAAVFLWRGGSTHDAASPVAVEAAPSSPASEPGPADTFAASAASAPAASVPSTAPVAAPEATPVPAPGADAGMAPQLLLPVQGIALADVRDTFDDARGSERRHEALDIMAPAGTPVLAAADGTIEKLFTSERGGLTIYQFEPTGTWSYYYAHLQAYAPGIAEGVHVRRGDVIGRVGSTGNADPAAPHLHFAVFRLTAERQWWTGAPVNPYPLLERP